MSTSPAPEDPRLDQRTLDAHRSSVESGQTTPQASLAPTPEVPAPAGPHSSTPAIFDSAPVLRLPVVDPLLFIHVTTLGDLEQTRIATENRLRSLTNVWTDDDGTEHGFGLPAGHPDVDRTQGITDALVALEHGATLNLKRSLRGCAIYPWIKAQRGLGDKQVARLLGAIGDPYWHLAEDRPRTVSELWAYCGLHVLPAGHTPHDTHDGVAVMDAIESASAEEDLLIAVGSHVAIRLGESQAETITSGFRRVLEPHFSADQITQLGVEFAALLRDPA